MATKVQAKDIKNVAFLTAGTAPNYEITIPRETAYADMDRMEILVNFHDAGTGTITLDINGLGAKTITGLTTVTADEYMTIVFDVSQDKFILVSGASGGSTPGGNTGDLAGAVLDQDEVTTIGINNGITYDPTGTKLFFVLSSHKIAYTTLSTAYDITTNGSVGSYGMYDVDNFWISRDGLHMATVFKDGSDHSILKTYSFGTAWDLTTQTLISTQDMGDIGSQVNGSLNMSEDGLNLIYRDSPSTKSYSLSTAWDLTTLSTASYYSGAYNDMRIDTTGTKAYATALNGGVDRLTFGTAWDASTLTLEETLTLSNIGYAKTGVFLKDDLSLLVVKFFDGSDDKYQTYSLVGSASSIDTTAIHKATAGEIEAMTEKVAPISADMIVIEDSADGNQKKKVEIGNLPGGTGAVDSVNGETGTVVLETDNITEATDHNYVTDAEKTVIANTTGSNSGDQDISGIGVNAGDINTLNTNKADKTNVLELDNTTPFTPDQDYEPATKKYVDDNVGGSDSKLLSIEFGETITAGALVKIMNDGGVKAKSIVSQITSGADVTFNADESTYTSATLIDTNKVFIAYKQPNASQRGKGVVATISGTVITYGAVATMPVGFPIYISAVAIDTNKVFIAYEDNLKGRSIVATISGTTITYGAVADFSPVVDVNWVSATKLDTNKVFIGFVNSGVTEGRGIVATISGTTITYGAVVTFDTVGNIGFVSATKIDTDKVFIGYEDQTSHIGKSIVATISGTVITYGAIVTLDTGIASYVSAVAIDTNKVFVGYENNGFGRGKVATISGTVITYGAETTFNSGSSVFISTTKLDTDKVFIGYRDLGDSSKGNGIVATISGTVITYGAETTFNSGDTRWVSAVAIDTDRALVGYSDHGDSSYGKGIVLDLTLSAEEDATAGIAQESGVDGETKNIILLGGISSANAGLSIGEMYYIQTDGSISTVATAYKIGRAISATELNLSQNNI